MFNRLRNRTEDEQGFTLMELLIVIIILGILVAVSVPVYLNQREKAVDAAAKADVRGAQVAAEVFGSDHDNSFTGMLIGDLQDIEPSIPGGLTVTGIGPTDDPGYILTLAASGGGTYILTNASGIVSRTCSGGACVAGVW